jgi:dephospho-CoA kinase
MKQIALTGGLATGKSFVRESFQRLGVSTFDADTVARAVVDTGTEGLQAVIEHFGDGVRNTSGGLDRQKLAELVFHDSTARMNLESIIHPLVGRARDRWFSHLSERPPGFAIAEIPLLYEAKLEHGFDAVVVVACTRRTQILRAVSRGDLTEADVRLRIDAQTSLDEKLLRANYVVRTDGTFEETSRQVVELYRQLQANKL